MMSVQNLVMLLSFFVGVNILFSFDGSQMELNTNNNVFETDTIPLSKLDTIISFNENNCSEITAIYEVFPNDMVVASLDTISIVNYETYEETMQIVVNKMPKKILLSEVEIPLDCIEQIDTITEFNPKTYEESIRIIKRMVPRPKE